MAKSKCPLCGCERFHVKDPDDPYEVYEFECRDGEPCFDSGLDPESCPDVKDGDEAFCNACTWHDQFRTLK